MAMQTCCSESVGCTQHVLETQHDHQEGPQHSGPPCARRTGADQAMSAAAGAMPGQARRAFKRPSITIEKTKFSVCSELVNGKYKLVAASSSGPTDIFPRALRTSDDRPVALKAMRSSDAEVLQAVQAEFRTLQRLQHPHIISALDIEITCGRAVLVLDHCDGIPLGALVRRNAVHFSEAVSRQYAVQLFSAVGHMHQKGVIHRGVRPANVLVSPETMQLTLVGFHSACDWSTDITPLTSGGDQLYTAPEVVEGESPTPASDTWCAGLCLFFMLSGRLPQGRARNVGLRALQALAALPATFEGKKWDDVSEACKQCLCQILAVDPQERPTADLVLQGAWLDAVNEDGNSTLSAQAST